MLDQGVALAPGPYEAMFPGLAHTDDILEAVLAGGGRGGPGLVAARGLPARDRTPVTGPGPLIASGRDADIYAYGEGLVLRRSRAGRSMETEARLMAYARDHGYPVPAVDHLSRRRDRPDHGAD